MQTLINDILQLASQTDTPTYEARDFKSPLEVRWCAGCGDYSILTQVQKVLADAHIPKENAVFISGIGCSSRFPYYMNTYGFHTIHGRATAIASGLKMARPDLSVWIITGDGDALSIGGNHLIHLLRRNINVNILLFNNQIYGLTKGQYSPTSQQGAITKSSPHGSIEEPFHPAQLALGAGASFVARTMDRDVQHLRSMLAEAMAHEGTSLVEIYQNCVVFNDGAFDQFSDKTTKAETTLFLQHGAPMLFGVSKDKAIIFDGLQPRIIAVEDALSRADLPLFDQTNTAMISLLDTFSSQEGFPRPFGVLHKVSKPLYETVIQDRATPRGEYDDNAIYSLLQGKEHWSVQ